MKKFILAFILLFNIQAKGLEIEGEGSDWGLAAITIISLGALLYDAYMDSSEAKAERLERKREFYKNNPEALELKAKGDLELLCLTGEVPMSYCKYEAPKVINNGVYDIEGVQRAVE